MKSGRELFEIWAPRDSVWSPWAAPVLFAQIECRAEGEATRADTNSERILEAQAEHDASPGVAVVVDLPGGLSVRAALELAGRGFRPVPLINASPGPMPFRGLESRAIVTLDMSSLVSEICSGTLRLQRLALAPNAPPAFFLDSQRLDGTAPVKEDMFDNRWRIFPQDFPSARFLADQKIARVILIQKEKTQPLEDLSHVLLRWQEAGIEILVKKHGDEEPPSRIEVSRPSRFKASWYRALAILGLRRSSVGGFGSFIPHAGSGG